MRTYITTLMLAITLGLVSCGGSNDVASSGATAVSAAAPTTTTVGTEAKVNGQVDERTGVAPVVAQATVFDPTANGGCGNSSSWGNIGTGPALTSAQQTACANALTDASLSQCTPLGGYMQGCYSAQCISIVAAKMMGC